jgi:hypothetical protein
MRNGNVFVRTSEGDGEIQKHLRRWQDSVKKGLETDLEVLDWIQLFQDVVQLRSFMNIGMNLRDP